MRLVPVILMLLTLIVVAPAAEEIDPLNPAGASNAVRREVFRAEASYGRGEPEEAVRILQDALAVGDDRDHPSLTYRLGVWLLELGRTEAAAEALRRATVKAPDSPRPWADYARALYELGRYADAAAAFGSAHRALTPPDPTLLYYQSVAYMLADQPSDAVDVLVPLTASVPDTVPREWVQTLVAAAADAGESTRASAAVTRLLRDHPDAPGAWFLASQQSQLENDVPTAAARLQVADWLSPLPPADVRLLADLYGAAELPRQAARTYARLWPERPDVAGSLAVAWLQAHEPDSARVVLDEALATDLDQDQAIQLTMLRGDLEYGRENWDEAAASYERVTALDPTQGRAWLMLGAVRVERGDRAGARPALERAAQYEAYRSEARRLIEFLDRDSS